MIKRRAAIPEGRGLLVSDTRIEAISTQIGHEFGAMVQYAAIATCIDGEGLSVLARRLPAKPRRSASTP